LIVSSAVDIEGCRNERFSFFVFWSWCSTLKIMNIIKSLVFKTRP